MTADQRPRVTILSVPHTGTRFVMRLLEPHAEFRAVHVIERDVLVRKHCDASPLVVIPLRHPGDCWRGWGKRGKHKPHEFMGAWWNLQRWADMLGDRAIIFPVDHPGRVNALGDIAQALGCKIVSDWRPVGREYGAQTDAPCPDVWALPLLADRYRRPL
jgi:hypothetical protein